ncbi:MAG: hypothetical protein K9H06_17465 [Melioribacteraceae bacterium]|nr:hypothetical protein [Melioribacteraceae bacterium]
MVLHKMAYYGYLLVALASLILGIRYSLSNKLMPYQLEALKTTMDALQPGYKVLLMNFMKSYAAGWIITGLSMLFLLHFPFRKFETWSYWALGIISLTEAGIISWRTYMVKLHSSGNPPLTGVLIILTVALLSFVFSLISRR